MDGLKGLLWQAWVREVGERKRFSDGRDDLANETKPLARCKAQLVDVRARRTK